MKQDSLPDHAVTDSVAQFRRLLDKLPAGAYTCDADGLITYFNRHAAAMWGREPRLKDPTDRFCGSFRMWATDGTPIEHDACWMAQALRERQEYTGREVVVESPDGRRQTVLVHVSPLFDDDGRFLGALNVLVDISAQKEAETVLREADRAKNTFIATLAHEIRNPLAPIRNAARILRSQTAPTSAAREAVDLIDRQLLLLTRLVDDLLDVGRITSSDLKLRREPIDLQEAVRAAVELSRPLIDAGRHRLHLHLAPEPIRVIGDLQRVAQVISNLLNNAATYTPDEGTIHLSLTRAGNEAVVRVEDTGIGISAQFLPHIFEFHGADGEQGARVEPVLGVGLTLAKQIVELHGGRIEAHSPGTGAGSEFNVYFPDLLDAPRAGADDTGAADDPVTGGGIRVLIVDDNVEVLESTQLVLEMMDFDVCVAASAPEALERGPAFQPDAVLLDIGLPGMDGWAAAKLVRETDWGSTATLIALTGWGRPQDVERSREAGFDHHLVKPMDPDALADMLVASGRRALDAADAA